MAGVSFAIGGMNSICLPGKCRGVAASLCVSQWRMKLNISMQALRHPPTQNIQNENAHTHTHTHTIEQTTHTHTHTHTHTLAQTPHTHFSTDTTHTHTHTHTHLSTYIYGGSKSDSIFHICGICCIVKCIYTFNKGCL